MSKTHERSRSYPRRNLRESIENISHIIKNIGKGPNDRGSIAKALGSETYSGSVGMKVSGLVNFGLLKITDEGYQSTDLTDIVLHPRSDPEKKDAIKKAFMSCPLYREILEKYKLEGSIPKKLENILIRDFGIISKTADSASKIFFESGKFAGILDENGSIITNTGKNSEDSKIRNKNVKRYKKKFHNEDKENNQEEKNLSIFNSNGFTKVKLPRSGIVIFFPDTYSYKLGLGEFSEQLKQIEEIAKEK